MTGRANLTAEEREALFEAFQKRDQNYPRPATLRPIEMAVERIVAARVDAALAPVRALAEDMLKPWGPYSMGGFEGCTDGDPEHCACATDQQPTCELCGTEIEPGEQAWSRQWPCYNTLPLDHADQDWDVISWHDECPPPARHAALAATPHTTTEDRP